jgi:hypothetical protein
MENKEEHKSSYSTYFIICSLLIIILALVMVLLNRFHPNDASPKPLIYAPMVNQGHPMPGAFLQQQLANHLIMMNQLLKAQAMEMQKHMFFEPNTLPNNNMNDIAHMAQDQLLDMMQHIDALIDDHGRHQQRLWHTIPAHESEENFYA